MGSLGVTNGTMLQPSSMKQWFTGGESRLNHQTCGVPNMSQPLGWKNPNMSPPCPDHPPVRIWSRDSVVLGGAVVTGFLRERRSWQKKWASHHYHHHQPSPADITGLAKWSHDDLAGHQEANSTQILRNHRENPAKTTQPRVGSEKYTLKTNIESENEIMKQAFLHQPVFTRFHLGSLLLPLIMKY